MAPFALVGNSIVRTFASVFAGIYTILATHLLAYLLMFASVGLLFYATGLVAAQILGYADAGAMWLALSESIGIGTLSLRLIIAAIFHGTLYWGLRRPFAWIRRRVNGIFDAVEATFLGVSTDGETEPARRAGPLRVFAHGLFIVIVTILIIPFLIQPTIVSRAEAAGTRWSERTANLLDGTASVELVDSVPGYYRRWFNEPLAVGITNKKDLERSISDSENPDAPDPKAPPLAVARRWIDGTHIFERRSADVPSCFRSSRRSCSSSLAADSFA